MLARNHGREVERLAKSGIAGFGQPRLASILPGLAFRRREAGKGSDLFGVSEAVDIA